MWGRIFFPGHRPIFVGVYPPKTDLQGAIPRGWCLRCGTEVFSQDTHCMRCKKKIGGSK